MNNITCSNCKEEFDPALVIAATDYKLCQDCTDAYNEGENKTGYCSLSCIITGHCDDSC